MSPRAAARLDQLGFRAVYDYVGGKADWLAAGLPREGAAQRTPFAGDAARDVPTCGARERLGDVLGRIDAATDGLAVVVDDDRVVIGLLLFEDAAAEDADTLVEEAMRFGPTTIRASEPVEKLAERLSEPRDAPVLVTDPEGRLLGLVDLEAAEQALASAAPAPPTHP